MTEKTVGRYVGWRLEKIRALPEHPRKAMLANLRRGVGHAPGEIPELWGSFLQDLPEAFQSRDGIPTPAEWAVYLALTLYALHQQSQTKDMNRAGAAFGAAVRRLTGPNEEPQDSSVFRRFNALATAASMAELSHHLRGVIQLLRRDEIPLDYSRLAEDLFWLQFPSTAPQVRLRWGQEYYAAPDEKETQDTDSGKENPNEE